MTTIAPASIASATMREAITASAHSVASVATIARAPRAVATATIATIIASALTVVLKMAVLLVLTIVPNRAIHGTLMQRTPSVLVSIAKEAKAITHVPDSIVRVVMLSVPHSVVVSRRVEPSAIRNIVRRNRFSIVRR